MISDILKRLQEIDVLIREHRTGTPGELAKKIGVSERTVYQYIKVMKGLGAPIEFDGVGRTYYYKEEGSLVFTFSCSANTQDLKSGVVSMEEFVEQMNKQTMLNNN